MACALLGLTACAKSGPEPVFSHLDTAQITSGEVHYWSSAAWAEMTQEDLNRIGPLLQEVEGTPQSGDQQQPYISASILPTFRLTLSDGSQWTITLYGLDDIDLIVTTSEGEAYYEVAQEQLNPILEIIQSYDLPDFTPDPQAQPELVCPNLDADDVASGEVSNWSIGYQTPLTQEDLTQAVELLQPLEGLPLPGRHAGIPQRRRANHTVYLHRLQPAHRHPLRTVRHRPDCHHPGRGKPAMT